MIKAYLSVHNDYAMLFEDVSIEIELQAIPQIGMVFVTTYEHQRALEDIISKFPLQYEKFISKDGDIDISDAIYVNNIEMHSNGNVYIEIYDEECTA